MRIVNSPLGRLVQGARAAGGGGDGVRDLILRSLILIIPHKLDPHRRLHMHAVLCTVIVYLVRFGRDLRPNFFGEILPPLRRIGGLLGGYAISIGLVGEGT